MAPAHGRTRAALACGMLLLCGAALGQVRPDAGSLERDLEKKPLEAPRQRSPLSTDPARPAPRVGDAERFSVAALRIRGNTAFDAETLLALVRDELVGRSVTLAQVQAAAAKITAFYRSRGYLVARAYIPAQRVDAARADIEIAVLEGALGRFSVENRSRLSDDTAARFAGTLEPGTVLNESGLERRILLLSDQAGVGGVSPVLRAGERTGTSDLALGLEAAPAAQGRVELDNWGNSSTGAYRLSGQLDLLSPLGLGDSFSARVTESFEGLSSGSVRAAIPLGGDGFRLGASYTGTHYKLGEQFAPLQASGTARAAGAFAGYPIVRSQRWNLNASLGFDAKDFEDRVGLIGSVIPRRTRAGGATLSGDARDPLAAGGVFVWSVTGTGGRLWIDEPAAAAVDSATAKTQGGYRKANLAFLYLQSLGFDWSAYASVQGQWAGKNLDSSEKFALGGPQGVRGYPAGEAAGDEGALGTLELRYALPSFLEGTPSLALFVDRGYSRTSRNPFTSGPESRTLGAAGLGLTLVKADDFSLRGYVAVRTTGGPATADADRRARAWLIASKSF